MLTRRGLLGCAVAAVPLLSMSDKAIPSEGTLYEWTKYVPDPRKDCFEVKLSYRDWKHPIVITGFVRHDNFLSVYRNNKMFWRTVQADGTQLFWDGEGTKLALRHDGKSNIDLKWFAVSEAL